MIIPVRCFTCGKVIADKYLQFQEALKAGKSPGEALDDLGLTRYCCRRMILSHAELLDEVIKFSQHT
ncbi:MAG: DNA-directed RNA polymerase subunit N [Candidatus Ranarchaeia archaeon]